MVSASWFLSLTQEFWLLAVVSGKNRITSRPGRVFCAFGLIVALAVALNAIMPHLDADRVVPSETAARRTQENATISKLVQPLPSPLPSSADNAHKSKIDQLAILVAELSAKVSADNAQSKVDQLASVVAELSKKVHDLTATSTSASAQPLPSPAASSADNAQAKAAQAKVDQLASVVAELSKKVQDFSAISSLAKVDESNVSELHQQVQELAAAVAQTKKEQTSTAEASKKQEKATNAVQTTAEQLSSEFAALSKKVQDLIATTSSSAKADQGNLSELSKKVEELAAAVARSKAEQTSTAEASKKQEKATSAAQTKAEQLSTEVAALSKRVQDLSATTSSAKVDQGNLSELSKKVDELAAAVAQTKSEQTSTAEASKKQEKATNAAQTKTEQLSTEVAALSKKLQELAISTAQAQARQQQLSASSFPDVGKGVPEVGSNVIDERIKRALRLYQADVLGKADYAMAAGGASIIYGSGKTSQPYRPWVSAILRFMSTHHGTRTAAAILEPDMTLGNCFAFAGTQGMATVRLSLPIVVRSVTIDHVSPLVSYNMKSAPKQFAVYGLETDAAAPELLGEYEYDIGTGTDQAQEFGLGEMNPENKVYEAVQLVVRSNHGHDAYTCIYRFRVHGVENSVEE
eukprot:TRINITY_DN793_c0_g1_i1.p1 TRINITY_DN793_c0_g1~~TRINITY_DN793_c0_g1_i1.p1  ORF type:complete len:636 (-),score=129.39 TRINITY_DN793_c0_g1_i1:24-1931(-)